MSFHAPIPAPNARLSLRAHLLLTRPITDKIDRLGASYLAALGESHADISAVRHWHDGSKLALRMAQKTAMVAVSDIPLSGAHFLRALTPFCPPADRAAKMSLIGHHEGVVSLRLNVHGAQHDALPATFLRAVSKLARSLPFAGLLWMPTGQLHQATDIVDLPTESPDLAVLLSPHFTTIGPRHLPIIRFVGAADVLGYALDLHLLETDRETAIGAGLAFAAACQRDPLLRARGSFTHATTDFRIAHSLENPHQVTLIPVQRQILHIG